MSRSEELEIQRSFSPNWKVLEQLRTRFLSENFSPKSYWDSTEVLNQYDYTFAQRIGWKWDAVLSELQETRCFEDLQSATLIDWGCGTGIATRKFLDLVGHRFVNKIILLDKSQLACRFAQESILKKYPEIEIETNLSKSKLEKRILLVSHVLNELSPAAEKELLSLIETTVLVIWLEPGTPASSSKLIEYRERFRKSFSVLAPCPHQEVCGLLKEKNSANWCHFFAAPPSQIFRDSFWSEFSKRLQIDLRALPTSFLVIGKSPQKNTGTKRLIGRARHYKGYSLVLACSLAGVLEEKLLKRDSKQIIDIIDKNRFATWLP
ncbi:MAG: methyltransferase [Proteobacteria bacterium]|nr:methyltransferase [Pseudomonadota bacterium]